MKLFRSSIIFALGWFALVAQTLLFRDFLTAFEGSELGVGSFFGTWLLWVVVGALSARAVLGRGDFWTRRFQLLALLYIPAFLLQQFLIAHARQLGGVATYEVYPLARMLPVSLVANAPISFATGFLFTAACRWWSSSESALPVARIYVLETFGSFVGGVAVTFGLATGIAEESLFLMSSWLLALAAGLSQLSDSKTRWRPTVDRLLAVTIVLGVPIAIAAGLADRWSQYNDRAAWRRLLPSTWYRGSFTTPQAKYLYGEHEGQFAVVSWGGVSEILPNTEHASEVIALSLAQQPNARRVLVVGPGSLGICIRFTEFPQIDDVVWLNPDAEYPAELLGILPDALGAASKRVQIPHTEVRAYLRHNVGRFDLILLNLPEVTTLTLNRYWTQEFFALARGALNEQGVVCARISGGANYLGGELSHLGSSARLTLQSVLDSVVLKPGDETWLIASDTTALSTAPALLRDRFAAIEGSAEVYPPEGLFSLYEPDRIEFQEDAYEAAARSAGERVLLNTDRRPKALLFGLMVSLRRAQFLSLGQHLPILLASGVWIAACPVVVYGFLRVVYVITSRGRCHQEVEPSGPSVFDSCILVLTTGLGGMSSSILLMYLYQSHFGSLFLDIGLISSIFMLGSCVGGLLSERVLVRRGHEPRFLVAVGLIAQLLLLTAILLMPATVSRPVYALLFAGCGLFVGAYFPIAAHRLRGAGYGDAVAGSSLETLDHLGGAAGGVLTGCLLLPVLGSELTLVVLALLVSVNIPPAVRRFRPIPLRPSADWFDRSIRPAGYCMVGLAACVLIASHIVLAAGAGQQAHRLLVAARVMTQGAELTEEQFSVEGAAESTYFTARTSPEVVDGVVFDTDGLAEGIHGYGGPIVLAMYVDQEGALVDLRFLQSRETPAYVDSLGPWLQGLAGQRLFCPAPLEDVDTVSGATMTSRAVLHTLRQSGPAFAHAALGMVAPHKAIKRSTWIPDIEFACLAALMLVAICLRYIPGRWTRRALLLTSVLVAGLLLNLQYSTQQVMALLSFQFPGWRLSGSFFLVFLVPLLVLLFGNVYCGYVCPFGALQELVGDVRPARVATDPAKHVWRYGRVVKYALLLLVVVLFALTWDYAVLAADPLITFFSRLRVPVILLVGGGAVALAFVFRRFWCRNLCPAGAFLALLCGIRPLKKLRRPTGPARCDLGVRNASELDCLCCDRCRQ